MSADPGDLTDVFVSGGSNIDAAINIKQAVAGLREEFGDLSISRVYRSPAVGFEGDDFLNLVIGFKTDRSPHDCAAVMTRLEEAAGRTDDQHGFTARPLDLDMVLYGDLVDDDPVLRLPRDDVEKYAFVLAPLTELAPSFVHPVTGKTIDDMWNEFDQGSVTMTVEALGL